MGHERLGNLPKTERWQEIVRRIETLRTSEENVAEIARLTSRNVRDRYQNLVLDSGVRAAFRFLVLLAVASRSDSPQGELSNQQIVLSKSPTLLELLKAVDAYVSGQRQSHEYSELAQAAAIDAISQWYGRNRTTQQHLFQKDHKFFDSWRRAGTGTGFCELSRLFFARLTERYLKYFLEREASAALPTIDERERFEEELSQHVSSISRHAFETAKITQSFAAGWFNKNATGSVPSARSTAKFLSIAFGKMSEELERGERRA